MNQPHRIRLAGPWYRSIVSNSTNVAENPTETIHMPLDVVDDLGADFCGRVEYRRPFHRPTGIDDTTNIILALDHVVGRDLEVLLNDQLLGRYESVSERVSFAVCQRLEPRNELCVRLSSPDDGTCDSNAEPWGLVGAVQLEIS